MTKTDFEKKYDELEKLSKKYDKLVVKKINKANQLNHEATELRQKEKIEREKIRGKYKI